MKTREWEMQVSWFDFHFLQPLSSKHVCIRGKRCSERRRPLLCPSRLCSVFSADSRMAGLGVRSVLTAALWCRSLVFIPSLLFFASKLQHCESDLKPDVWRSLSAAVAFNEQVCIRAVWQYFNNPLADCHWLTSREEEPKIINILNSQSVLINT